MSVLRPALVLLVPTLLIGCGGNSDDPLSGADASNSDKDAGPSDARYDPECWPSLGAVPGGTVDVAVPDPFATFEDDDELTLVIGPQGGVHIDVQAQISGLEPGDPEDSLSDDNPFTRFSAIDGDGIQVSSIPCAFRTAYRGTDDGLIMDHPVVLFLQNQHVAPGNAMDRIGETWTIGVEVIDAQGLYASDTHSVTVTNVTTLEPL